MMNRIQEDWRFGQLQFRNEKHGEMVLRSISSELNCLKLLIDNNGSLEETTNFRDPKKKRKKKLQIFKRRSSHNTLIS